MAGDAAAGLLRCSRNSKTPQGFHNPNIVMVRLSLSTGRAGSSVVSFITSHLSSHLIRVMTADRKRKDYYDSLE